MKKELQIFVIQKHDASHLHYDFRLELAGVLKSWAVPKGLPKKGEKHLAILVEDHNLEYANFEGIIPEGQYGAGKVEIEDKGSFENLSKLSLEDSFQEGNLKFHLNGKKFKGNFSLIKTKIGNNSKNWLLINLE